MRTANREIREASSGSLQEVKNNGKSLTVTRGSNCKALTGKILVFLDRRSLMGSGRLWE